MPRFGSFNRATGRETPKMAAAAAMQGELDSQAKMQANALRSQNMAGGAELYNAGMGDNTPIADKIGSWMNTPSSAQGMDLGLAAGEGAEGALGSIDAAAAIGGPDAVVGTMPELTNAINAAEAAQLSEPAVQGLWAHWALRHHT